MLPFRKPGAGVPLYPSMPLVGTPLILGNGAGEYVALPRIAISNSEVPEDAEVGDLIGTLSVVNGSGSYTFSITADPDSKFAIDGDDLEVDAGLDYDTATSHSVTIEADNGVDDPISRTFTIAVTNVLEVTLGTLSIDDDQAEPGVAWSATITGKSSGSTITATSSDSTILSVVDATVSGTFAADGTPNITLTETHPDATNSPNDTVIGVTVAEDAPLLDAPVLAWLTDETDSTPAFSIDIDPDALSTDIVRVQVSSASNFGSVSQQATTAVADIEDSLGLSTLADGLWYVRARIERPEDTPASDWSNVVSKTIGDETAPTITSANTAEVDEDAMLSHSLTANETVTWSIVGGADQAEFEISGSTLRWVGNGTKDYETPDDSDTDNDYVVTVRATDAASNTTDQTITVTVNDVSEGGGFALAYVETKSTGTDGSFNAGTVNLGSYDANRVTAFAINSRLESGNNIGVSSVTLDGNAVDHVSGAEGLADGNATSEVWYIATGAGTPWEGLTTAALVVNFATGGSRRANVDIYRLVTSTPTPSAGVGTAVTGSTSITSPSITVPSGGGAIATAGHLLPGNANDMVWPTATKDASTINLESFGTYGSAHTTTPGAQTIEAQFPSGAGTNLTIAVAAWGP